MKKMFLCSVMLLFAMVINSQTYNSIVLNQNDGTKDTILTNEIDSITYDDLDRQIVWSKDGLYKTAISALKSTIFEKFELPNVFVKTEGIGDWAEMRIHKDGTLIALKKQGNQDIPSDGCLIIPDETLGVLYSSFRIDENGMPKYITINDCVIAVDNYYDNYVDITVAYNDTIAYSLDSIPYNRTITRAWSENNWQRNLTGIIELASGAAGVVGGALLITGSVISEAGSFGVSTPISIPGIVAGSVTIAGGVSSINSGWEKLFTPGEFQSNIGESIYYQSAGELIANGPQNTYVPEQYFGYLKDPNYSSQLGKAGWINFFVGLTAGVFDNLYGRTVTWENISQYYQGKVITGLNKDISTTSATVRGYISPDITKSLLNGQKIENEYGVILYSTANETERYIRKVTNGDGGMIEYTFYDLKPATTYNYRVYYIDKTNGISLLGETKTFKTLKTKVYISNFKVIHSDYSDGAYYNDGRYYDYKFDVATTVEIESLDGVEDWGYVYKDPDGNMKRISLMQYGTLYTDSRYAYYRNEAKSTVCLYGYVKYEGDNKYYDDEPQYYPLEYSIHSCPDDNHPHWIDLGLPSGTLWSCCNAGASKPEEFGEYFTYDQMPSAPSKEQMEELLNYTNFGVCTKNGIKGYEFSRGGKSIFLPAAGSWYALHFSGQPIYDVYGVGLRGYYWTSTSESFKMEGWNIDDVQAYSLYFGTESYGDRGIAKNSIYSKFHYGVFSYPYKKSIRLVRYK